jgi:serine protease Do
MAIIRRSIKHLTGIRWAIMLAICATVMLSSPPTVSAERGFMGMQVQGISPRIAAALGVESASGVLIKDISIDGPASNAGLRRGDLIISMQGTEIDTFERLLQISGKWNAGDKIDVVLWRAGKEENVNMVLSAWPASWVITDNAFAAQPDLGLTFAALTPKLRERLGIRWGSTGFLVTVSNDQFAGATPLRRGDVVTQINQQSVWEPSQFLKAYADAKKSGHAHLLMLVERADGFKYMLQPVASDMAAPAPTFKLPGQGG